MMSGKFDLESSNVILSSKVLKSCLKAPKMDESRVYILGIVVDKFQANSNHLAKQKALLQNDVKYVLFNLSLDHFFCCKHRKEITFK